MNKLILMISILLATVSTMPAHADEDGDDDEADVITQSDVLLEKDFAPSAKVQGLHVMIHKAGHLENRPYVLDVSESCPTPASTENESRVIDTYSACDVAQNTLEFDAEKSEIAMLVRTPADDGTCTAKPKKIVMQLQTMCE